MRRRGCVSTAVHDRKWRETNSCSASRSSVRAATADSSNWTDLPSGKRESAELEGHGRASEVGSLLELIPLAGQGLYRALLVAQRLPLGCIICGQPSAVVLVELDERFELPVERSSLSILQAGSAARARLTT
jgi:hypothetical protein